MTLVHYEQVDLSPREYPRGEQLQEHVVDEDEDVMSLDLLIPLLTIPIVHAVRAHKAPNAQREVSGEKVRLLFHQGHGIGHEHGLEVSGPGINIV